MSPTSAPRIVIHGIGQYGSLVARMAIAKGWPIVAVYNRAGDKIGKDLGELLGLDKSLGIVVQDCETADYSQLDADIAIVTASNLLRENLPAYTRFMKAGLNVLCHGAQSYFPRTSDPETGQQIQDLATANGVSFTGGGIWDMSRIWSGILAAGPCTDITAMHHFSITNAEDQAVNAGQITQIGCGLSVEEFYAKGIDKSPLPGVYITIPQHVLSALGLTLKETRSRVEPVTVDQDIESPLLGKVPAGHCIGPRIIVEVDTEEGISATAKIDVRLFLDGEVEHMMWEIDGKPRNSIRTERKDSDYTTAACLFNRIPDVIAAPAGIQAVSTLGPLKPTAILRK